ncbi:disease resistance protein RGA2-like [Triticum urartu]|uniref:disease resistance protein RGA2-like n=1 Tax=Triticum urartu TaxID=4572 RepID=UPI00204423AD|nr:disease resistance protein RGA2-like [Triticum urartu]
MEVLISAAAGDLVSRFISFLAQSYGTHTCEEEDRTRLERILLRMHSVVEEAEGRHITNRGMLRQLKALIEGMYLGYYMLDRLRVQSLGEESIEDDEVSHRSQSFAVSTFNTAKRLRFAASISKNTPVAFGTGSTTKLKSVVESLEAHTADMREFVMLLGSCPRLSRQPYDTYLHMDKCMFGRHIEKEQLLNFLLSGVDSHDGTNFSILPIIGPCRVGKKTLVQHACRDERVRGRFSDMFFYKGDDPHIGEFAVNCKAGSGKYLFVVDFSWDVNAAAWENFRSCLQKMPGAGSKIVVIGRTDQVAEMGTAQPIRMKSLPQEEYWYFFKALAFGSMDPDEYPKLASLGMQLATQLNGSFLGANIIGGVLRANPDTKFWCSMLLRIRELVRKHGSFGIHPVDLFERNIPINFTKLSYVGAKVQGCWAYDLRETGPEQSELPKLTWQQLITGAEIPDDEDKFDVLAWRSRIPPYRDYIVTFEKQKPRRKVSRRNHLAPRKTWE